MKRFIALALALATVVALAAAPAPAAAAPRNCPDGYVCLYTGYQYTGTRCTYLSGRVVDLHGYRLDGGYSACNNNTKSWHNNSFYNITFIDGNTCDAVGSGWRRGLTSYRSASGEGSDWINRMSSIDGTGDTVLYCGATV